MFEPILVSWKTELEFTEAGARRVMVVGRCVQLYKQQGCNFIIMKTSLYMYKYTENFTTKTWTFSNKNSNIFHISAQNIDCGYSLEPPRQGGYNEYPQSMFFCRNKKNNAYPGKPHFYYRKVGFKGVNII